MNLQPYIDDCLTLKNHLDELNHELAISTRELKSFYKRMIDIQEGLLERSYDRFQEATDINRQEFELEVHNQVINSLFK